MATDVSGTIHIIAEVMGDASSPVSPGQGSVGSPNKRLKDTSKTLKIMGVNIGKLIKILTVGGLLKLSQNISNTLSGFFQILGALVDLFMIPFVPAFVRALGVLYPILGYLARLSTGEKNMGDIWGDLGDWWGKQVEEEGGVWGAIKELALDVSAVGLLAGLFLLADPTGLAWRAGKFITYNLFSAVNFSKNFIIDAFGLRKKTPLRQKNLKGVKVGRTISRLTLGLKDLIDPPSRIFQKSSIIGKAWLTRVFGFAVNLVPFLGGAKWKALAKLTSAFVTIGTQALSQVVQLLFKQVPRTLISGGVGTALGAFIAGVLIIAGVVVGTAWLMNKLFPFDDEDYLANQIKQSQDEGNAEAASFTGHQPTFVQNDAKRTAQAIRTWELQQAWDKQQEKINRQLAKVLY